MTNELETFVGYEGSFRGAVDASKLPANENVDARRTYFAALQNAAENAPEILKRRAVSFNPRTPQPILDAFAGALNRVYNDTSGGYFAEQKDTIVRQVEDKRLEGLVLAINHPEEGNEARKGIVAKIKDYQQMAALNEGYDNRKVKGEQMLNIAKGVVAQEVEKDIEGAKAEDTNKYVKENTWNYLAGTLALIDMPDTADEARKITGRIQKEKQEAVYRDLDTEGKRAGFVRESFGYLPAEAVRPVLYDVATAELRENN